MITSSPISSHQRHTHSPPSSSPFLHSIYFPTGLHFRRPSFSTKTQTSCSPNESDDDGYGSLVSSNLTLSRSSSSIFSDISIDENSSSR
jgi:hypothetical protein